METLRASIVFKTKFVKAVNLHMYWSFVDFNDDKSTEISDV